MNSLGERLKDISTRFGGVPKFADMVDARPTTIYGWLKGTSQPRATDLAKIAEVASVSVDWLVTGRALAIAPTEDADLIDPQEAIRLAGSVARAAADKSDEINLDPDKFSEFFMEMLRHAIETEASREQVDNVVSFAVKRALR